MTSLRLGIPPAGRVILLGSVFIVAACGLVYELIAGAVSSYILGNAVTQFSLVIGVFLCSMGLGSFLAKFITARLLRTFIEIEIWIGLVGGVSSIAMFSISAFAEAVFPVFFFGLCILLGLLIGIEIPLLIRILKDSHGFLESLSHVLALDYIGALAGSIAFPLIVLPYLGLSRASVVFGIMNLAVAGAGLTLLSGARKWMAIRLSAAAVVLFTTLIFSTRLVGFLEDLLYQDYVVYAKTSAHQRIVLTRWRDDIRLYLNGHLQFSAMDEARYHEALVIPAMESALQPRNILILGGGDGLAAREVLKYRTVNRVTLVDFDPAITGLGRSRPELLVLNQGSLNSEKLTVVNQDAMKFVEQSRDFFDVIIIDLPDPSSETLAKLYSKSFYALCARRLRPGGVLVTQATSPLYAPKAFWCIFQTLAEAVPPISGLTKFTPVPYHVNVPSFGEWGFVLASRQSVNPKRLSPSVSTRFLNSETIGAMFSISRDMQPPGNLQTNRLDRPVLYEYYRRGWKKYNE